MNPQESMKLTKALSSFINGASDIKEVSDLNLDNIHLQAFTKLASVASDYFQTYSNEITGWNSNIEWK